MPQSPQEYLEPYISCISSRLSKNCIHRYPCALIPCMGKVQPSLAKNAVFVLFRFQIQIGCSSLISLIV